MEAHEARAADRTSRRDVLKKAAVAGGIVWVAPVISTMSVAAAAQEGSPTPGTSTTLGEPVCETCGGDFCFGQTLCGASGPFGICGCAQRVDGDGCFCYEDDACAARTQCPNGQSDCPSGEVCVHTCCDTDGSPVCFAPCGTNELSTRRTARDDEVCSGMSTGKR